MLSALNTDEKDFMMDIMDSSDIFGLIILMSNKRRSSMLLFARGGGDMLAKLKLPCLSFKCIFLVEYWKYEFNFERK